MSWAIFSGTSFWDQSRKVLFVFDAWGVKLFKFKYKDCEYGIGWLPLGGYVKIAGMIDESMDTEQLKGEPQEWEFRSKPAWQRLIVMLGGIIVNVIVGVVVFWMLTFKMGTTDIKNDQLVNGIVPGEIGKSIGLQAGDRIMAIDGVKIENYSDLISSKLLMGGVDLTVNRAGVDTQIHVPADILNTIADKKDEKFIEPRMKMTAVAGIQPGSEAVKMGFMKGDSIIAFDQTPILFFDQFKDQLNSKIGKPIELKIVRNGQEQALKGVVPKDAILGFNVNRDQTIKTFTIHYSLLESLPMGAKKHLR